MSEGCCKHSAHSTALRGSFSRRQVLFKSMWDGRVKHQADRDDLL